jgi:Uma2 family endonuclease
MVTVFLRKFYPNCTSIIDRIEFHGARETIDACPVAPELVVEVVSPGQTFGQMALKASRYLAGGVLRVWVVDPESRSITVLYPAAAPVTYGGDEAIVDELFPGLSIAVNELFG